MIDAYEIGIQLMLQDDVTAGLEVINRGLAEVDRAIAATSAKLAGLGRETEVTTKAASATSGIKGTSAPASSQAPTTTVEPVSASQPSQELHSATPALAGKKPTAPETKEGEPVAPDRSTPTPPGAENNEPYRGTRDSAATARAPIASAIGEAFSREQRANQDQIEPQAMPLNAPTPPASAPSDTDIPPKPAPAETASARQDARRSLPNPPHQFAITASVKRHEGAAVKGARQDRTEYQPVVGPEIRRERTAAPWSAVADRGIYGEQSRSLDRAAAPTSNEQNQNSPVGGTVMLDGRLVGQWLSEHMAREASRPPAGTSFFDPRQTPAWNVSGAV